MAKKKKKSSRSSSGAAGGGKKLVVVESPAKARTINKYLGPDFVVKASMGHVRDLPSRNPKGVDNPVPGVDVEHDFAPTYEPLTRGKKVLAELRKLAKTAPEVFLATDLDREGEAIAWHLAEGLGLDEEITRRVVFNEITRRAIGEAFEHPRQIDMDMVNAQQARRILDRIVGYQVSPLLWKKVAGGLSAGRVQSVALRLIVEREREIDAFDPEEYWKMGGVFCPDPSQAESLGQAWREFLAQRDEKGNGPTKAQQQAWLAEHNAFEAELAKVGGKRFKPQTMDDILPVVEALGVVVDQRQETTDDKAKGVAKNKLALATHVDSQAPAVVVQSLAAKQTKSRPPAPFTTASLQQTASSQLRLTARQTMRIAQQLYEGIEIGGEGQVGLITYMRTDSRNISRDAITAARGFIGEKFGDGYLPEKPNYYTSGPGAQEAHEAIRPTNAATRPDHVQKYLTAEQYKLYSLIWKRFIACQMTPAVWNVTEVELVAETAAGPASFRAMGRTLHFDGYMKVAGVPVSGEQLLPELDENQRVGAVQIDPTQHFTQPPPRYTEASLIKALEADNIGRPSTYAAIIQTVLDRNYVERNGRTLLPTDLGTVVTDKLVKHFPKIFEVRFTAHMEDELDKVEQAESDWVEVLREFYGPFVQQLETAREEMVHAKAETQPSDHDCPECGAKMEYRFGKNGKFLSCTRYPDCKAALPIDREGNPIGAQHTDIACPECGAPLVERKGRFGPFLSCTRYPDCKGVVNLDRKGCVKPPSAPPLAIEMECPKCGNETMNLRRGKRGPWISCARYPKCRGRVGWKALPQEKRDELEAALEKHEEANPVPVIKTLDGTPVGEEYKPQTVTEDAPETSPEE
jgi:DNA topoisomerase I